MRVKILNKNTRLMQIALHQPFYFDTILKYLYIAVVNTLLEKISHLFSACIVLL